MELTLKLFCIFFIFTIGFVVGTFTDISLIKEHESLPGQVMTISSPKEIYSPFDRITENQIHVYNSKIVIDLEDAEWAYFTDTNSMDPVIDAGSNAIEIIPKTTEDIHLGDIVSYKSKYTDSQIIHRVIQISNDSDGWYAVMKGDNNPESDPGKIRFHQIRRVVVAIIY